MSASKRHFEWAQQLAEANLYFTETIKAFDDDMNQQPPFHEKEDRIDFFNSGRALINHLTEILQEAENAVDA